MNAKSESNEWNSLLHCCRSRCKWLLLPITMKNNLYLPSLLACCWVAICRPLHERQHAEPTIDEASTHGELCFIFGNVQNCKLPTCLILFNVIFYLYCTRENYKPVCKLIYIYIHIYKLYTYLCCLQLLHIDMFSALECLRCLFDAHGSTPHDASHFVPRRFAVFFVSNPICKILVLEYRHISTLVL